MLNVFTMFSGGLAAVEFALKYENIEHRIIGAAEFDKYARQQYLKFHDEPTGIFYKDVRNIDGRKYRGKIDLLVYGSPCQDLSLAGKRKGFDGAKSSLFREGARVQKEMMPKNFIFENVKGLLSSNGGRDYKEVCKTFRDMGYNIHTTVMNTKDFGVPQNRERVFIIGFLDEKEYHSYKEPVPFKLETRLKDLLEDEVDEKYFLSQKMIKCFLGRGDISKGYEFKPTTGDNHANCLTVKYGNYSTDSYIKVKSATKKGYELATENDSINFAHPDSKTRRGRVGKGVAQTLDCACSQGVIDNPLKGKTQFGWHFEQKVYSENSQCTRALTSAEGSGSREKVIIKSNIRKLTPRECYRLQGVRDRDIDLIYQNKTLHFLLIYDKINLQETKKDFKCNVKLKNVKEKQIQKNMGISALCTIKEKTKLEQLMRHTELNSSQMRSVNIAIQRLGKVEQKECAANTIKWTDCTETLFMLMTEESNQDQEVILEIQKGNGNIEKLWKITLEENLSEEKLFITLIALKQIIELKIFTYAKMPVSTLKFTANLTNLKNNLLMMEISSLRMEYIEQTNSDTNLYKIAGNAISVNVMQELLKSLYKREYNKNSLLDFI